MDLSDVWTVPGGWVFRAFIGEGESFDAQAQVELAPALGAAFWLVVVLAVYAGVVLARRSWTAPGAGYQAIGRAGRTIDSRSVARAAWRAQAVHVLLYAGVPLVWEAGRWVFIVALLPLFLLGFGDRRIASTDGTLDHLTQPACWTFVTFCSGPRSNAMHDEVLHMSDCDPVRGCPPPVATVRDFGGWGWKSLWLVLTVGWVAFSALRRSARFPHRHP